MIEFRAVVSMAHAQGRTLVSPLCTDLGRVLASVPPMMIFPTMHLPQ
jgi:hypothetical protein